MLPSSNKSHHGSLTGFSGFTAFRTISNLTGQLPVDATQRRVPNEWANNKIHVTYLRSLHSSKSVTLTECSDRCWWTLVNFYLVEMARNVVISMITVWKIVRIEPQHTSRRSLKLFAIENPSNLHTAFHSD
jgi:hypothetical protein